VSRQCTLKALGRADAGEIAPFVAFVANSLHAVYGEVIEDFRQAGHES
jgi:hypothetical protein